MLSIDLPWPSKLLSPNARPHWAAKARAAKKARQEASLLAGSIGRLTAKRLKVVMVFSPPDRRRRDADNLIGSTKAARDGIADAIGVDDSHWDISIRRTDPVRGGNVRVEIEVVQ